MKQNVFPSIFYHICRTITHTLYIWLSIRLTINNNKNQRQMTNIDWRAFWTSFATIIIALIVFAIVIQPMIDKYKVKVVKPEADEKKAA